MVKCREQWLNVEEQLLEKGPFCKILLNEAE